MKGLTDYKYNISMKTKLGQKNGTVELFIKNGSITGFLNILGKRNSFEGTITNDGNCTMNGNIVTLVQSIPYTATGYADNEKIDITLKCKKYNFHIYGNA